MVDGKREGACAVGETKSELAGGVAEKGGIAEVCDG